MSHSYILAAARQVDGQGSLAELQAQWAKLCGSSRVAELVIDPLDAGWDTSVLVNHFRSGCAPVEALAHGDALIRDGHADAVLIRGEDLLRSRYAHDKATRQRLMAIYGQTCPIPEAYTQLAHAFMRRHGLDVPRFHALAEALRENYARTARRLGIYTPPRPEAMAMATELFRLVDCANPVVDFTGALILGNASLASASKSPIAVLGVAVQRCGGDGPAHVEEIARYDHLTKAWASALNMAGIDFTTAFHQGVALLEAYTCFPVVPLGFLLANGLAQNIDEITPLLSKREITVTGGMNTARAPWNNPALNALIVMCDRLWAEDAEYGAVQGNGGLGYRQGVALLGRR